MKWCLICIISSIFFVIIILSVLSLCGCDEKHESLVHFKVLSLNDFHGHLFSEQKLYNRSAGGARFLFQALNAAISASDHTILALTGDTVGASPRDSALLFDEPTVLFFNMFAHSDCTVNNCKKHTNCNVISVPGNHEYDNGLDELFRKVNGGNGTIENPHVVDPCPGMAADVICANVVWKENGTSLFPPYTIRYIEQVPVAFIGAVTIETPMLELPMYVEHLRFLNESESINRYVQFLQKKGIHAFVILLHEGGEQQAYEGPTRNGCLVRGPVVEIVKKLDPDVDVVLAAHAHNFTNAYLPNAGRNDVLVVQAYSYGKAYADVDIFLDPATGDVASKTGTIVPVYADEYTTYTDSLLPLREMTKQALHHKESAVISETVSDITRVQSEDGGSLLGNLVADSQRDAMGADIALVTCGSLPGSLHADLRAGLITWADLEQVLPPDESMAKEYGGWYSRPRVATRELNGTQIKEILERQWNVSEPEEILSVSGLVYHYNLSRPVGDRVTGMWVQGSPVVMNHTYLVAMNYYMAYGRGMYTPGWEYGVNVTIGPTDIDALESHLRKISVPIPRTHKKTCEKSKCRGLYS